MNLINNIDIASWNSANVSSSTSRSTPLVDCSGYHGVTFMLLGSTLSGSSKITAVIQGATANSTATLYTYASTPISSSTAFGAAASRNYKVLAVDCPSGLKYRWNRMRVNGSTGVGANDKFLVIRHTPRLSGSTTLNQSTTVGVVATMTVGTTS